MKYESDCPHCGKHIQDLYRYLGSNENVFECPHCEKLVAGYTDYRYVIYKAKPSSVFRNSSTTTQPTKSL